MEKALVKNLEILPPRLGMERTDLHFDGDHKIILKQGEAKIAPTSEEIGFMALLVGRNDANNPRYRYGRNYMYQYLSILFRDNNLEYERNIRSQILNELEQSESICKLLKLRQELL